ncbi:MAG: HD domain-containing protein [Pirellulaceae bacterium]|nr:HD domain-containing protein [Pirellulaceae bacterium]
MTIAEIPEVRCLDDRRGLIRIPPEIDVPLTDRVRQIIDTSEFRRLASISQLGLVSLVYPAAHHTRFEHSLGVYRIALLYLRHLANNDRFAATIRREDAELFIVSSLLHDLGHWPFCHPIEDIHLPGVPEHELFANSFLLEGEIADSLRDDWGIQPRDVVALLSEKPRTTRTKILHSMLSGPIDVDKMDYLGRDSLHAGVPYGRNFDQQRLIASLTLNQSGDGLAISEKGRTAAEMMVFARYVMFSEVYWHHAVRCATAMLQRAFFLLHAQLDLDLLFRTSENELIGRLREAAGSSPAGELLAGLFGPTRQLYKRYEEFSFLDDQVIYERLARRPYAWLVACAEEFAIELSRSLGRRVAPHQVLFDAPPVELEVEFQVEVYSPKRDLYRPLGEVSPVVRTLAQTQFDHLVKRVRIFVHPDLRNDLQSIDDPNALLHATLDRMEA